MADQPLKNLPLTQSVSDLGLGDILKNQVESDLLARQKQKQTNSPVEGLMSPAATMLLGGQNFR